MNPALRILVVAVSMLGAHVVHAQRTRRCVTQLASPSVVVDLPGSPFQALPSLDGCRVYVSLPTVDSTKHAIAVLELRDRTYALTKLLDVHDAPTGMVLTHDGRLLIVAATQRVLFIDTRRIASDPAHAVVGELREKKREPRIGRIYANVTRDDRTLFVADEGAATITVIDLPKARASNYSAASVVGQIPTGAAPIALTFSPDERVLYATSQRAPAAFGWPTACRREAGTDSTLVNAQGAIHVIDVRRARTDPAHAVVASIAAGCNPVRLVTSPAGDRAYVSSRGSNALLVFDTSKLISDSAHALIARVAVGSSPVGVAVVDRGRKVIVTNSNRFSGGADDHQYLTVVDATKIGTSEDPVIGSIAAGAFPREMRVTPDGRTLLLTNFASKSLQAIDLTRLPMEAARR